MLKVRTHVSFGWSVDDVTFLRFYFWVFLIVSRIESLDSFLNSSLDLSIDRSILLSAFYHLECHLSDCLSKWQASVCFNLKPSSDSRISRTPHSRSLVALGVVESHWNCQKLGQKRWSFAQIIGRISWTESNKRQPICAMASFYLNLATMSFTLGSTSGSTSGCPRRMYKVGT